MIRLAVDDEARALSAWKHAEVLYVGEDVMFAPQWATHVWKSPDGHLYYVCDIDLADMPLGTADTRELY
nr:MAG TPA: hypothetical protein [Caudoviricetes sp.]